MNPDNNKSVGLSGLALNVPPYRVDLKDWCSWNNAGWDKVRNVIGSSFRMLGPQQSIYTMAANSVLRLIEQYDIDPQQVGFLALGTESSTDNSAGAIIVKGIVDDALRAKGKAPLSRNCEVPEFKHACLGGIYALKNALRYLSYDGRDRQAIVVCSDIALYELGSSGEPTQGAGAVAMLLESDPQLAQIDLNHSGSAASYRAVDFRKPIAYKNGTGKLEACRDIPVFNGKYSTSCYVDEILRALEDMYSHRDLNAAEYLQNLANVFMHRPFRRMPETGLGMAWLAALASGGEEAGQALRGYCADAGLDADSVFSELTNQPDVSRLALTGAIDEEVFPVSTELLRTLRKQPAYTQAVQNKMSLGADSMMGLGNIYSGALPAWLAAGFEEAEAAGTDLTGQEILLLAYGSGDAAEAIPVTVAKNWREAAQKIGFKGSLDNAIDLTQEQYLAFRDRADSSDLGYAASGECIVERVGSDRGKAFQDAGIEYYRYNRP